VTITETRVDREGRTVQVPVRATIVPSITRRDLSAVTKWATTLKAHGEEDASWDWPALLRTFKEYQREGFAKYEFHALRCQGQIQALMILKVENHSSQITGDPMVYMEFIAVAPWN